jgi:hypothetical protein
MVRLARLMLAAVLLPAPVAGEPATDRVVLASPPHDTSVTIYRAPDDRFGSTTLNGATPDRLDGYALISELRDVDLPAGPAVVRFAGVAAGMLAESVVVSGLPDGVREKNLDAQLLSPRHLYAGWFGRPVTLRRIDAKGVRREEPAVIRSGPDGAAIVQTYHGFEAVNCGPFEDTLIYPGVPAGLYASPTLSIATDAPAPAHVRLRLTYLAWDYDWRADYVLKLAPDLRHGELSAWLTLASADVTSFPASAAAVVAGRINFSETRTDSNGGDRGELVFHCFPRTQPAPPVAAPPPPMMLAAPPMALDIVVTAARKSEAVAQVENLGDVKLYRLPLPTTVAARAQKQVALFEPRAVVLEVVHTIGLDSWTGERPARLLLRTRNRTVEGLGLALPAGRVRVLVNRAGASAANGALVVGQGALGDRAINDRVEILLAPTPLVQVRQSVTRHDTDAQAVTVTVSNASAFAVRFLGTFKSTPPASIRTPSAPLAIEDGHRVWAALIPAHGHATLRYSVANR